MGRYLRYITDQQLERLSIAAKNLVHIKWEKFRYPHGRNKTKNVTKSPEYVFKKVKIQNETAPTNDGESIKGKSEL
jgi:hypothetical protein